MFKKRIISLALALLILLTTSLTAVVFASAPETSTISTSANINKLGVLNVRGTLSTEEEGRDVFIVVLNPDGHNAKIQDALTSHPGYIEAIAQVKTGADGSYSFTHELKDKNNQGEYTIAVSAKGTGDGDVVYVDYTPETNYLTGDVTNDGEITVSGTVFGESFGTEIFLVILKPEAMDMDPQVALAQYPELVEQTAQITAGANGAFSYTHTIQNKGLTGYYKAYINYRKSTSSDIERTVLCHYEPVVGIKANSHFNSDGTLAIYGYALGIGSDRVNAKIYAGDTNELKYDFYMDVVDGIFKYKTTDLSMTPNGSYRVVITDDFYEYEGEILTSYFGASEKAGEAFDNPGNDALHLFVNPNAGLFGTGTEDRPFATLNQAADMIKALSGIVTDDITVFLKDGNHYISETIEFTNENDLADGKQLTFTSYPGERATIHGGRIVRNWQEGDNGIYYTDVVLSDFRELYVNGELQTRARTAEGNFYQGMGWLNNSGKPVHETYPGSPTSDVPNNTLHQRNMDNSGGYSGAVAGFRGGLVLPKTGEIEGIQNWGNPEDIEVVCNISYKHHRMKAEGVIMMNAGDIANAGNFPVLLLHPENSKYSTTVMPNYPWKYDSPFYMENALELLDEEGEWYYDNDAYRLYYMPKDGEDMRTAVVEVPQIEHMFKLTGTIDDNVSNVAFRDLDIECATSLTVARAGYAAMQAGNTLGNETTQAAITLNHTNNVDFVGCTIRNIGAAAISLVQGAVNTSITDNEIYNIGASAVQIGTSGHNAVDNDGEAICTNNEILRNKIYHVAWQYTSNTAIWATWVNHLNISYNEIYDTPYSGISVGWGWSSYQDSTTCHDNTISYNKIYDNMLFQGIDGGAIYTLGTQPGTQIHHNYIYTDKSYGHCIYLDEGSDHIKVYENVINVTPNGKIGVNFDGSYGYETRAVCYRRFCEVYDNFTTIEKHEYRTDGDAPGEDKYTNNTVVPYDGDSVTFDAKAQSIIDGSARHGVYIGGGAVLNYPGTSNESFLTTNGTSTAKALIRVRNYDAEDVSTDVRVVGYEGLRMKVHSNTPVTFAGNTDTWYAVPIDATFCHSSELKFAPRFKMFFWENDKIMPLYEAVLMYN